MHSRVGFRIITEHIPSQLISQTSFIVSITTGHCLEH